MRQLRMGERSPQGSDDRQRLRQGPLSREPCGLLHDQGGLDRSRCLTRGSIGRACASHDDGHLAIPHETVPGAGRLEPVLCGLGGGGAFNKAQGATHARLRRARVVGGCGKQGVPMGHGYPMSRERLHVSWLSSTWVETGSTLKLRVLPLLAGNGRSASETTHGGSGHTLGTTDQCLSCRKVKLL